MRVSSSPSWALIGVLILAASSAVGAAPPGCGTFQLLARLLPITDLAPIREPAS